MIDIHIHILPDVDDGSPSMDNSLHMAELAASSGVDTMIMTPHCNIPNYYDNYYSLQLMQRFRELKLALERNRIPIQVLPGMEIFTTEDIVSLIKNRKVIGLNFSNYLLVEFNFDAEPEWMTQKLSEIRQTGHIPIVAHPERYDCTFEQPETAIRWIETGCLLQCNKGSFLGSFGRKVEETAHMLLDHQLVSFIASDAHRTTVRTPHMEEIFRYVAYRYSEETALRLMHDNPLRVCRHEAIAPERYIPFESRNYWKI